MDRKLHTTITSQMYQLSYRNPEKRFPAVETDRYYRTLVEQCTDDWHELRYGRITGTRVKYLLSHEFQRLNDVIYERNQEPIMSTYQSYCVNFGLENEPIARENLARELHIEIEEWGLLIDKEYPQLAVSLDGFVPSENATVEIKCPQRIIDNYYQLCSGGEPDFERLLPYNYYSQVQLGLFITQAQFCYFYVFAPREGTHMLLKIPPDRDYHQRLINAYYEYQVWDTNVD